MKKKHKVATISKGAALEKLKEVKNNQKESIKLAILSGAATGLGLFAKYLSDSSEMEMFLSIITIFSGLILLASTGISISDEIEKNQLRKYLYDESENEKQ